MANKAGRGAGWRALPAEFRASATASENAVLLETGRRDTDGDRSLLFVEPVEVLVAWRLEELNGLLRAIDTCVAAGQYVAGFFAYECGECFVGIADGHAVAAEGPLAWFGVYAARVEFDHATGEVRGALPAVSVERGEAPQLRVGEIEISVDEYARGVERVQQYLREGDSYQVNFTNRICGETNGDCLGLYEHLLRRQPVSFAALVNRAEGAVLSFSPELFYRTTQGQITVRPMKGTWTRGRNLREDEEAARALAGDEKNRSEHVMIVDLLRNDLGRVCEFGSVQVEELFHAEHYRTLLQMTSTISGTLRDELSASEVFRALFPSGSITGAPKRRTMEIIREVECGARGVYTGAIGYFGPGGEACFSVAIRTLEMRGREFSMGVGGGITVGSVAEDEFDECRMKAAFLTREHAEFSLIETMYCGGGMPLLARHLGRLAESAAYFEIDYDEARLREAIAEAIARAGARETRIRLELAQDGRWEIAVTALDSPVWQGRVLLAEGRTDSRDVFLQHKTTRRSFYNEQMTRAAKMGFDEVLFLNEAGLVTEGAISNVLLEVDGSWMTPATGCGVLPGTKRAALLAEMPEMREREVWLEELARASAIWMCNGLRGVRVVREIVREDGAVVWEMQEDA